MKIKPTHIIIVKKLEGYGMCNIDAKIPLNTFVPAEFNDAGEHLRFKVSDFNYAEGIESVWHLHPDDVEVVCPILVLEE